MPRSDVRTFFVTFFAGLAAMGVFFAFTHWPAKPDPPPEPAPPPVQPVAQEQPQNPVTWEQVNAPAPGGQSLEAERLARHDALERERQARADMELQQRMATANAIWANQAARDAEEARRADEVHAQQNWQINHRSGSTVQSGGTARRQTPK